MFSKVLESFLPLEGPRKSWEMLLILENPGYFELLRSLKVVEFNFVLNAELLLFGKYTCVTVSGNVAFVCISALCLRKLLLNY